MVNIRRLPGPKNPAEMTYYAKLNGSPIAGASAAKTLSSLDSQTMALTLGHFVQVQAERKRALSPKASNSTTSQQQLEDFWEMSLPALCDELSSSLPPYGTVPISGMP